MPLLMIENSIVSQNVKMHAFTHDRKFYR